MRRSIGVAVLAAGVACAAPAHAWYDSGVFFGFSPSPYGPPFGAPPFFAPPVYVAPPPPYYAPPAYYAPPTYYQAPVYRAPAAGGCYAGPYVCPLDQAAVVGGPCSCPVSNGRVYGQAG